MKRRPPLLLLLLIATAGLQAAPGAHARPDAPPDAPNLNPFRRSSAPPSLSPVRLSQAEPAPPPATPVPAPAAPPSASPPGAASAAVCERDDQCAVGTICDRGVCRRFERSINILLFRKEGAFTAFIPFYFSRRGNPGYRVLAPFYWHFWSPDGKSRIVAPFYWRFEDHLKDRVVTVIPPYAHTRQPDAESWAVWPLFYASTKFGWAAPLLGSFKIASPERQSAYGLYALLYFWKRSPERRFDLGFPLFVSSRSAESTTTFALPLNVYWRRGTATNLLVAPLFFRSANQDRSTWVTPLGYRSTAGDSSRGSVAWLYWYGRKSDSGHDVLVPFVWSFRSPNANTTVVPPVAYLRRGDWSLGTVLPLVWWARDRKQGTSWTLLFPLYFSRSSDHGRTKSWLTPVGGYKRDDAAGSQALTFVIPPLVRRRDATREFDSYLLLYWRYRNVAAGSTTTVAGPIYWRNDPQGSTRVAFPLFWYFRDAAGGATAHTLVPFYFRRRSPDETLTAAGIFPLWGYRRTYAAGGGSAGLFPLAFFGSRDDRRHAVVFPLLWHFSNARSTSTLAFPAFYRFAEKDRATGAVVRSTAGVPPLLYFAGYDHGDSYKVQFPLFWRFVNAASGTRTTVIPPVFFGSGKSGWYGGLAPFVFAGGGGPRRHFVLAPLFWHFRDGEKDRTTTVALNYMHRRHGGETTDALFPLLHYRRGAKPGGQDETSFTLFPLVHYRRDARATVFVSPLAAWGRTAERKGGVVLPYFWYGGPNFAVRGVPPVWFDFTRLGTSERTRVFGPYVATDAPGRWSRVLFPLFARYRDEGDSGTYVFPTYFRRRAADGYALDALFPLFWRSTSPVHSTTVVGPWFRRVGENRYSTGLPPLYVYAKNAERRLLLTPLLVHHRDFKADRSKTWSLLLWRSTWADGHRTVVFPLWWSGRKEERSHRVLFPLYWHFANANADGREPSSFSLAGPLLWSRRGTQRTRGLMPVFWYSRDDEKKSGSNALLPLFYERHSPGQRLFVTPLFGFRKATDRTWWYAIPFYLQDGWRSSFGMLFPLWFSHLDKVTETRTRVVPPLLHFSRQSPQRSLSTVGLLFWRHKDITSSATLVLPLFYDVHQYQERRLTMLLPLFFRHRSETSGQTYTIAPLFYRRTGPTDSTTVAFPLVWDWKGGDRRTTVVFPFYVGVKRPTWQAKYIFPNILYRKGLGPEAGTSRLFVFPLWESRVKRPGDYQWEVLLGLLGWERIGRNRFLKVFFIPFELEAAPAAQTAWYGGKTPPPRRRARGLATQAW